MTSYDPRTRLLTSRQAATLAAISPATLRVWAHRGHLSPYARDDDGRPLWLEYDVLLAEKEIRHRRTRV